ncbi:nucleotidyltransferase domain-containing protein [Deinococcus aestuarii]|uniref:nucleotidyltransferase domain-containing protein n=1 Tax=Deinococcus aestuarii TaxID=2774531 RepID=UPI001C0BE4BB|nr:nucleotidyltransferase domain-containing protein [Deinococcus aestuarii]
MTVPDLARTIAAQVAQVPGVVAVSLGGSHARGNARPDLDLGLAYDAASPFDLTALGALCRDLDDSGTASATPPGGWGPWVDGGAWLTVGGQRVDFIYRELGRVEQSVKGALAGRVSLHAQPGHPHGIHGHHYAAELATGVLLHDPEGKLERLKVRLGGYPAPLAQALEGHYGWQPGFWLDGAVGGLKRGDVHDAQGRMYQAVMALVQTLCARERAWILNEKGAVALAGALPGAPHNFAARVNLALAALDVEAVRNLAAEVGWGRPGVHGDSPNVG